MRYEIWQANPDTGGGRKIMFCRYELLKEFGLEPSKKFYNKVYEGECYPKDDNYDATLEGLYIKFQGVKPDGYTGHSLSISDVVILGEKAYYVDDFGFKNINFE